MSNNKQNHIGDTNKMVSSVEWYNQQLNIYGDKAFNKEITLGQYHIKKQELLEQAKAMHKEEIINTWYNGYLNQSPMPDVENCGEIFYNKKFGGNNEQQ